MYHRYESQMCGRSDGPERIPTPEELINELEGIIKHVRLKQETVYALTKVLAHLKREVER